MAVLGAPADYEGELRPLPAKAEFSTSFSGNFDWIQIFVRTKKELDALAPKVIRALNPDGLLWISFPKGSSGIQRTCP
jgi:hypothetical protein